MSDLAQAVSVRSFAGRLVRMPLRLIPKDAVVPVLSGGLRGARWVVGSGIHGCWLGIYEADKQRRFAEFVRPGMTVFDIGAHVGFYTLLSSRLVGPEGRVFAFEPNPRNLPRLERHVALNKAVNTTVMPCAVAEARGEMGFELAPALSTDSGYMGRISEGGSVRVRVECLDQLLDEGAIVPADLVKIDVEGAERLVLEGGRRFFTSRKPTIFLATHGEEVHRECCELLRSWGYALSSLDEGKDLAHCREVLAR